MSVARAERRLERDGVEYVVRPFRDGDRAGFLRVYESVLGFHFGPDWFEATYGDAPFVDHVPVFVVECEGEIVGIRPFAPYRVRVGDRTVLSLLGRDTIVHPDHRRRGLFTAATEFAHDRYAESDVGLLFSQSNHRSRPGYEKMGWSFPTPRETFVRTGDGAAFVGARIPSRRDAAARTLGPVADGYVAARDALRRARRRRGPSFAVETHEAVPAETLARLHGTAEPAGPHPVFDETTVRYHLGTPEFDPVRTYVARDGETPVAALAVHPRRHRATDWLSVVHVAPIAGGDRWRRALSVLLARVVSDHPSADAYRVAAPFPRAVLRSFGFLSNRRSPMAWFEPPTLELGIRPTGAVPSLPAPDEADWRALWHLGA